MNRIKNRHIIISEGIKFIPNFIKKQQVKNPVRCADFDDIFNMTKNIISEFSKSKDNNFFKDRFFVLFNPSKNLYYGINFDIYPDKVEIRYVEEISIKSFKDRTFNKKSSFKKMTLNIKSEKSKTDNATNHEGKQLFRKLRKVKKTRKVASTKNEDYAVTQKPVHWSNKLDNITSVLDTKNNESNIFKITYSNHLKAKRGSKKRQTISDKAIKKILSIFILRKKENGEIVDFLVNFLNREREKQLVISFPNADKTRNIAILIAIQRLQNQYKKYSNTPIGFLFSVITMIDEDSCSAKSGVLFHFPSVDRVYIDGDDIIEVLEQNRR